MKRFVFVVALAALVSGCASTASHDHGKHGYKACVERMVGGRILHDPGWVVEEEVNAATGYRVYHFLSTYWNRVIDVTRVNRFCTMLNRGLDASMSAQERGPAFGPPSRNPSGH